MAFDGEIKKLLITKFYEDQKLAKKKKWTQLKKVYQVNSSWLKEVIKKYGWPSEENVGLAGEQAAWLIAQNSGDIRFQSKCLKILKNLPQTKERKQFIAFLSDSINILKNKKQLYGTQFKNGKPLPIKDRKKLDRLREEAGLPPFKKHK